MEGGVRLGPMVGRWTLELVIWRVEDRR